MSVTGAAVPPAAGMLRYRAGCQARIREQQTGRVFRAVVYLREKATIEHPETGVPPTVVAPLEASRVRAARSPCSQVTRCTELDPEPGSYYLRAKVLMTIVAGKVRYEASASR